MHLPGVKIAVVALNALTAPVCSPVTCEVSPAAPAILALGLADSIVSGITAPFQALTGLDDDPAILPSPRRNRR